LLYTDEPGLAEFEEISYAALGYQSVFTKNEGLFYVNMMPSYADAGQIALGATHANGEPLPFAAYENYIERYLGEVKPAVYSYDYYPMIGTYPAIWQDYFKDMYAVKSRTEAAGVPFWTFIQRASWGGSVRVCNQAENDWQVHTSIAMGAKGIQYFTYWTPWDDAGTSPGFYPSRTAAQVGAMVGPDGSKQDGWYIAQKTNRQVNAVGKYMINAASLGVIQAGGTPAPIPAGAKILSFRKLASAGGTHSLVGCFDYKGNTLLYVVNNSITEGDSVTLNFSEPVSAALVQNAVKTEESGASLQLALNAGEGVMVLLN
jgi:hypothetical protein